MMQNDLDVLYGDIFGLSDSQKELIAEWLETYLPKEREQIITAYQNGTSDHVINKKHISAEDYYKDTYEEWGIPMF